MTFIEFISLFGPVVVLIFVLAMVYPILSDEDEDNVTPVHNYCVGREFAFYLGPRLITDGAASGEAFRNIILKLLDNYPRIRLDFTRCHGGCSAAWFDEAFGKLSDHGYRAYEVFDRIEVVTKEPTDILLIAQYIHPEIHRNDERIIREVDTMVFETAWKVSDGIV